MAVNKNFVVKNGLEVDSNLIFADATNKRVGIASTTPNYTLNVAGGIGVTDAYVSGFTTLTQDLQVGSSGSIFYVSDSSNAVGIGTSLPAYLLDVRTSASVGTTALYVYGDTRISGDLNVIGDINYDEVTGRNLDISGIATIATLGVSVATTSKDLLVTGIITSTSYSGTGVVTNGTSTSDTQVYSAKRSDELYYNKASGEEIASGEIWVGDDNKIATTAAIDARIVDLVDDVGGFVPIANETSFPNANPDINDGAGTLVSVPLANNITSNGSGVISISNGTVGNSTVTINGAGDVKTYAQGFGIIVETTSTLNTYTFHRYVPKATEVTTVASNITDINTVAGITANINAVAGDATDIGTVAGIAANVTTVADIASDVTTVAADATDIGNVSTNIGAVSAIGSDLANNFSNISDYGGISAAVTSTSGTSDITTVADKISEVDTVSGIASNVTTVAGISANTTTVAGIASNVTTVAGISGNTTTVAGISGNVTTVAGISANVTTVAGNNSNVTTCATNITAINGASANATAAAAAQTAAETAQTAAETAQTAAETAETNAETAETNAETAQTAAELAETNAETAQTAAELAETNATQAYSDTAGIYTQQRSISYNLADNVSTHTDWGDLTAAAGAFANETTNTLLTMATGSSTYNYGDLT